AIGYYAWCWTDAEPPAYRRAPYVRAPHETQFGVTDWLGELRPRGRVLSELAATARLLDLDAFALDGPVPAPAAIPVPHEYARPYDPEAFGLSDAPSGLYRPSESVWSPRRGGISDVAPLVRTLLNAFVMAARADMPVAFPRESLNEEWPDARLLLLPAPLASTTISLHHLRTTYWRGAEAFFSRGGVLYLSCSADVAIPEMAQLAGCRIADRASDDRFPVLRFVVPWGPFRPGDELPLPAGDGGLSTRGVRLALHGAEPVALDANGDPALVVAERGAGRVVTCAYPVELLLARASDAHGPSDRSWGIYGGLAALVRPADAARADHPDVTTGTLAGPSGSLTSITNHGSSRLDVEVRVPAWTRRAGLVGPAGETPLEVSGETAMIPLNPYGGAIVAWER
ncbi:MAG: hypothetical protein HYU54_07045, partial [Actinobacteria bacterium]|nr:hypothetical protein [Actinomycetota bacterium]